MVDATAKELKYSRELARFKRERALPSRTPSPRPADTALPEAARGGGAEGRPRSPWELAREEGEGAPASAGGVGSRARALAGATAQTVGLDQDARELRIRARTAYAWAALVAGLFTLVGWILPLLYLNYRFRYLTTPEKFGVTTLDLLVIFILLATLALVIIVSLLATCVLTVDLEACKLVSGGVWETVKAIFKAGVSKVTP